MTEPAAATDCSSGRLRIALLAAAAIAAVALRVVWPTSDAYPRLSWSSALLTDEGFYIHNARNVVLFGRFSTDQFNNALIMPLLHVVQLGVFWAFGVGTIQARSITIVLGLLMLPPFYDAVHRALGERPAVVATLFLALGHVSLLYSRLALMDTPAAFLLVCSLWAWQLAYRGDRSAQGERSSAGTNLQTQARGALLGCGVLLAAVYMTRGLAAFVLPIPFILLKRRGAWTADAVALAAGLVGTMAIYFACWYLPHHIELARVNHYYLTRQLLPAGLPGLFHPIYLGLAGYQRGARPFLMRHAPAEMAGCLLALFALRKERDRQARWLLDFCALWLAAGVLLMCTISYAPSRYYVIFWPPLCVLAAYGVECLLRSETGSLPGGLWPTAAAVSVYVLQAAWMHAGPCRVLLAAVATVPLVIVRAATGRDRLFRGQRIAALVVGLWLVTNAIWLTDWARSVTYRQCGADAWLERHLPAGSVIIGAVAPGLCMNNHFRAVNVIEELCNDRDPVGDAVPRPVYVVILDERWRERWWDRKYPEIVSPSHRVHVFRRLLRKNFAIGLYWAGADGAGSARNLRPRNVDREPAWRISDGRQGW